MSQRVKRNLVLLATALFLYGVYVVIVPILQLPPYVLLIAYLLIITILYFINRKNVWAVRGNYFYATGHMDKARKLLKKASDAGVKSYATHMYYALLLVKEDGNIKEAVANLEKALKLAKTPFEERNILITMATCHWMEGNADAAIDVLENVRNNHEFINNSALTTLGFLYLHKERYDEALEVTSLVIEDEPMYAAAWDNLGQIYFGQGEDEKAKEAFEKALSLKEYMADSNYFMGILSERVGDKEAAKEYFRKASISTFAYFNTATQEQADAKYAQYQQMEQLANEG